MGRVEKTVFISYRHTNVPWALSISQYLTIHGFDVFLDYKSINSGDFEQTITENVKARAHFLVLLAPSALEGCERPKDWLRREIELALESKRNIVPIMLESFDFGAPETLKYLTGKLEKLKHYQGLNLPADYFEEGMQRLCDRFLNISLEAVIHPVSNNVQQIVEEQKREVAKEAKVEEKILSASEWFERGYKSKEPQEQIRYYTKAIELNSKFVEAYSNRGDCYANLEQYQRAIKDYDQAIQLNPEDAAAYYNRGTSYADLWQYERAIKDYDQAIQLNPEDAVAYCSRGDCFYYLEQYQRAIEDYDQAIQLNPEDAGVYDQRGFCYNSLGQHQRAMENFHQAALLDPEYAAVYYNWGISYANLGQHEQAIKNYDQAIQLNPKYADAYCSRGISFNYLGQYQRAIKDYDKAIQLNPEDATAYYKKACCYALQGMVIEATNWLRQTLTKDAEKYCKLVKQESDFDRIRCDEKFQKLLEEFCKNENE